MRQGVTVAELQARSGLPEASRTSLERALDLTSNRTVHRYLERRRAQIG